MPRPVIVGETLCSEGDFSVVRASDGQCAALWKNNGHVAPSLDELKEANVLNQHELFLLNYGVKR